MSNQNSTHTHTHTKFKGHFSESMFPFAFHTKKITEKPQLAGGLRSLHIGDFIHQKPLQISGWWVRLQGSCTQAHKHHFKAGGWINDESTISFIPFFGMLSSPTRKQWHMSIAHHRQGSQLQGLLPTNFNPICIPFFLKPENPLKMCVAFSPKRQFSKNHLTKKTKTTQNSWRQTSIRIFDKHLGEISPPPFWCFK